MATPMPDDPAKERLRQRLDEVHDWPSLYMFKFILEPDEERIQALLALFPKESEVLRKYSSGGRFLSVTVKEVMMSAEEVIARYERVGTVPGVMAL